MTLIAPDQLPLTAPTNLRDLGGIPIPGGTVRTGVAIRADDLSTVDETTARELVAAGLSAVIDLRSPDEVALTGRGPLAALPVTYHHVPFLTSIDEDGPASMDQTTFGDLYIRMVEQAAPRIVQALAIIAHAPGAVAFHCAAGQDRTGVLAASLLLALGARAEDIVADYMRTGDAYPALGLRLQPIMAPLMARFGMDLDLAARAATRERFSPEPMHALLDHLHRADDPLAPLRDAGLSDGLVADLRARALLP